jgi:uncharacterized protein YraI
MKTKRYVVVLILVVASLMAAQAAFAQGNSAGDVITLNSTTPGIDVVITPAPGTAGTVTLELAQAAILVTDSTGRVVFEMADPRVRALELRMAPSGGSYTLTAERIPGVDVAYVRVNAQADLSPVAQTVLVSASQQALTPQQAINVSLSAVTPSQVIPVSIPANTSGTLTASFPAAPVTVQVVDANQQVVATLYGGAFDGLNLTLDGGDYTVTLLNGNPQQTTLANVQVNAAQPADLAAQAAASQPQTTTVSAQSCVATVAVASVNLRSGPGTGYTVLDYGFLGQQYPVGGMTPNGAWLVVGDGTSSAWMASTASALSGNCSALAVYDVAIRDAASPQITFQQPSSVASASGGFSDDHESGERDHDD